VAKPRFIELGDQRDPIRIPILYEDRSVLAIDKPAGWLLVPFNWQSTQRNLQAAITSSISAGDFWARCRNLRFLRAVHRLDGETSGILLLARSPGAVESLGALFESRRMKKSYLAVARGVPKQSEWTCRDPLGPDARCVGRMVVDRREGKDAETSFRVLERQGELTLIEASPKTGRTHQIRVHLQAAGLPIVGDDVYGGSGGGTEQHPMGLRAMALEYTDPFQHKPVRIRARADEFLRSFGFANAPTTAPESTAPENEAGR
jgi:RluA family pseudouridine synthase